MRVLILFAIATGFSNPAFASSKCALDAIGTPKCSKFPGGGAVKNVIGTVLCGKGECAEDAIGNVKCSSELGGGAIKNILGAVQCSGGCEAGSTMNCISPTN